MDNLPGMIPQVSARASSDSKKHVRHSSNLLVPVARRANDHTNNTVGPSRKISPETIEQLATSERIILFHGTKTLRPSHRQLHSNSASARIAPLNVDESQHTLQVNLNGSPTAKVTRSYDEDDNQGPFPSHKDLKKLIDTELSRSAKYITPISHTPSNRSNRHRRSSTVDKNSKITPIASSRLAFESTPDNPSMVTLNGVERPMPQDRSCLSCSIQ